MESSLLISKTSTQMMIVSGWNLSPYAAFCNQFNGKWRILIAVLVPFIGGLYLLLPKGTFGTYVRKQIFPI